LHLVQKVRIYAFHSHLYACSPRYGRKVFLYKSRYVHTPEQEAVLGAYAQANQTVLAYVLWPAGRLGGKPTLVSRNLKTGAVLRDYVDNCPGACTITRLVTNAKGSFAWIRDDEGPGSVFDHSVTVDDSSGVKVLDHELGGAPCIDPSRPSDCNEQIDLHYLVAGGGMVSWRGGPTTTLQSASFN
jgi:hypothetical protein